MPRVAQQPRFDARPGAMLSPQKSPVKIPLNDDREEKAKRFRSKQALHEMQMNQIIAAASPVRKRRSMGARGSGSPGTPGYEDKENDGMGLAVVGGSAVTPMKRVPILANFEEWMKMATDNKINAANSWNFALIDYFHDMSLLKEGDGVNFQKASCTLDGCVKIYTSRVDSVATETGKLLSGLADSGNKKRKEDEQEGAQDENEDEDEEGENGAKKKAKTRAQRSSEATLATSFAQLQLKKMELEFSVDPLFKKASADFDEGGAKGLLLNHLTVDSEGRIAFDSSDNTQDLAKDPVASGDDDKDVQEERFDTEASIVPQVDIDLVSLAQRFFPDLARLDEQDICPSLKSFELGGSDNSLDIPFLKASDDWKSKTNSNNESNADTAENYPTPAYEDDDDAGMGGFDVVADVGFGEGGEAWAKEAAVETRPRVHNNEFDADMPGMMDGGEAQEVGGYELNGAQYGVRLSQGKDMDQENILSYFDQALQKNWAGPEHWRIRKIKDSTKPSAPAPKRKEKEVFEVDFAAPLSQAIVKMLYTPAASNSAISLPKSQWRSKTKNLLPDDKHFNSKQLLRLFLKPKARIGARTSANAGSRSQPLTIPEGERDDAFWARTQNEEALPSIEDQPHGQYDADFFQDDGLGLAAGLQDDDDEDFADAREHFSPGVEGSQPIPLGFINDALAGASQGDGFGTQLVTQSRRLRPEYVQYARVAKKVDVRRLKEEMWKGIGLESTSLNQPLQSEVPMSPASSSAEKPLNFTSIMNGLQSVYPKQAMTDISTSFCFICLLHLANEKGLILENSSNFEEIQIQKDHTAEITQGGD